MNPHLRWNPIPHAEPKSCNTRLSEAAAAFPGDVAAAPQLTAAVVAVAAPLGFIAALVYCATGTAALPRAE